MQEYGCKSVEVECPNCHQKTVVWRDKDGKTKWICSRCKTMTVSKVMSRRHVQMDIYAPQGQVLMN